MLLAATDATNISAIVGVVVDASAAVYIYVVIVGASASATISDAAACVAADVTSDLNHFC
jgi:hypothetical protein